MIRKLMLLLTVVAMIGISGVSASSISGFKFNDINGNGTWDSVEPALPNWTIILTMPDGGKTTNTTNASGVYMFSNLSPGNYTLEEVLQPGWVRTFPNESIIKITLSEGEDLNETGFGNMQVSQATSNISAFNISGFKINGNTGKGIQGWNITLSNDTMQKNMQTGADGSYKFTGLVNGPYNVSEEMKPGFTPVGAMFRSITIENMDVTNVNFTNNPISAANRTFAANLTGSEEVPPVVTSARGNATFSLSNDGTVLQFKVTVANITNATVSHIHLAPVGISGPVVVTLYPGPTKVGRFDGVLAEGNITQANLTGPLAGQPLSVLTENMTNGNTYVNVHTTQHPDGEIRGQIRAVSAPNVTFNISGFKINGATGQGIKGWLVSAKNATTGATIFNTTTDATGFYLVPNLTNGTYVITEETRVGFTPSGPTSQNVTIVGQDITNINFTNMPVSPTLTPSPTPTPSQTSTPSPPSTPTPKTGSISGFKINDLNGNGKWDEGENGLSGWNIRLTGIVPETAGVNKETTTDEQGFYRFENLPAGEYLIEEKSQNNFVPTSPPVKTITLVQGENSMDNNFMNRLVSDLVHIDNQGSMEDNKDVNNQENIKENRDINDQVNIKENKDMDDHRNIKENKDKGDHGNTKNKKDLNRKDKKNKD